MITRMRTRRIHPRNHAPVTAEGYLEIIKARRQLLGLTQSEAAERVGMTRSNWSRVERGENAVPSLDRLSVMAEAVGMRFTLAPHDETPLDQDELRAVARLTRWYIDSAKLRPLPAALLSAFRKIAPYAMEVAKK